MKRTPLRRISLKRLALMPARRACVQAVKERDRVCQFHIRHNAWLYDYGVDLAFDEPCGGPLDVHEPARRSHGADPTDPEQCVLLCRRHHEFVHANPSIGKALGLITYNHPVPWRNRP